MKRIDWITLLEAVAVMLVFSALVVFLVWAVNSCPGVVLSAIFAGGTAIVYYIINEHLKK